MKRGLRKELPISDDYAGVKLYFKNSKGEERLIAIVQEGQEAFKEIQNFLDEHNFKSYYMRTWVDSDGFKWVDVGLHSEFFKLI